MSEKRFEKTVSDTNEDFRIYDNWKEDAYFISCDDEHTVECLVNLMNEQQVTISALKDIFKDIITYSEWDSKKPYCSLRIAVDKKTYYKIKEILNE